MKKWALCLLFVVFLSGCAAAETFENVEDVLVQPAMAEVGEITLTLPPEASSQTMLGNDGDKLYFCDGYTVAVQIMSRGDLDRTCRQLCGFGADGVNILETSANGQRRYDWVWTAAGEGGDVVGRVVVIDDGKYHYCVSLQTQAQMAWELESAWSELLRSFAVA